MQSVKMPVLTTTGKNLFDWEKLTWHMNRSQWSHGSGGLGNKNAIGYQYYLPNYISDRNVKDFNFVVLPGVYYIYLVLLVALYAII